MGYFKDRIWFLCYLIGTKKNRQHTNNVSGTSIGGFNCKDSEICKKKMFQMDHVLTRSKRNEKKLDGYVFECNTEY